MTDQFNLIKNKEKKYLSRNAQLIEMILEEFGLITRIVDIKIEKKYYEFQLEVTVGTDLEKLEAHSRDLALALASPTGKVKMVIPIPGRSLVGIQLPRPSLKEIKAINLMNWSRLLKKRRAGKIW